MPCCDICGDDSMEVYDGDGLCPSCSKLIIYACDELEYEDQYPDESNEEYDAWLTLLAEGRDVCSREWSRDFLGE